MVINAIKKAFADVSRRGWTKLYFYFDIHNTILVPDYDHKRETELEFFPYAMEVLKLLTAFGKNTDLEIVMGLYTCSHPDDIERYQRFFASKGIIFKYVNKNPEVADAPGALGAYTEKPYFNVLFEDKAGFQSTEWKDLLYYFFSMYGHLLDEKVDRERFDVEGVNLFDVYKFERVSEGENTNEHISRHS